MNRLMKWILGLLAGLVLVVAILAVVLPMVLDPNDYRDDIEQAVTDRTGLAFAIEGDIGWSVFPWIGIETGPMTLGNAQGYREPHLARLESVAVQVRLLPLLGGDVEAGLVSLNGLDLRAEVDADNKGNWESLLSAMSAEDSSATSDDGGEKTTSDGMLSLEGVEILDSALRFSGPGGEQFSVSDLDVETGRVSLTEPFDVILSLVVSAQGLPAPAQLSAAATLQPGDAPAATVRSLELTTDLAADLPASMTLAAPIEWRGDADALDLSIRAVVGAMNAALDGRVAGLSGTPAVDLALDIPDFDARPLLGALTAGGLAFSDPEALSSLSLKADLGLSGERLSLKGMKVGLDGSTVELDLDLEDMAALKGTFTGRVDRLDVDRYLPAGEGAADTGSPAQESADGALHLPGEMTGSLEVGWLRVAGLVAENARVEVRIRDGGLRLYPLTASLYGGKMEGELSMTPEAGLAFSNNLAGVDAAPMVNDLAGQPYLGGLGNLGVNLSLRDPLAADPVSGLNGEIDLTFQDGTIYGFNVMEMIRQAAALLDSGSAKAASDSRPETDFASLVLKASIRDGQLETRQFELQAPYFRMRGSGSIDLVNGTLSYAVTPVLESIPEGQGSVLEKLAGLDIPVKLSGNLAEPEYSIDAARLILASQRHKVDGPAGDLLDALVGEGEGDDKPDAGQALFDALLNEAGKRSEKKKDDKD